LRQRSGIPAVLLICMLWLPAHAGSGRWKHSGDLSPSSGSESTIQVTRLNDYLLFFFDGRNPDAPQEPDDWVSETAMALGIGTYAIHRGDEALVFDTFTSVEQAAWVRHYLENMGITRFTVVQSHWHLDHIAGNAVYADSPIISSSLTWVRLMENREAIEAGTLWGPPAIHPLVLPTFTFDGQMRLYVGDIEVRLLQFDIHTQDSTLLYLPRDKLAFVGDMLEDPLTYMTEVEALPTHLAQLRELRRMDIARIFPNHGDPAVITRGGYDKSFIDATTTYIARMLTRAHEEDFLTSPMEAFIGDSAARGWVHAYEPYRVVQQMNLELVHEYYQDKPLPDVSAYLSRGRRG
jgi:cyclase